MRIGFRWFATILFILLLPIWLLLLVPKFNNFGPEAMQGQLRQNNVYPQLSQILQQSSLEDTSSSSINGDATNQAFVIFRSALTADYLESKVGDIITDSSAWITGATEDAPKVSFNDIRDQVIDSYPAAQTQIEELQAELKRAQTSVDTDNISADGVPGLSGDGSASSDEIAELLAQADSLDNFASGDFTLELENSLKPAKDIYWYYWISMPVAGVGLLLILVAIFFLGRNWTSSFRWTGWTLIAAAAFNLILAVIFSVAILQIGINMVIGMIPGQAEVAGSIAKSVAEVVFANYLQIELIMSGTLLLGGIIFIISSIVIRRRQAPTADTSPPPVTPVSEGPKAAESIDQAAAERSTT